MHKTGVVVGIFDMISMDKINFLNSVSPVCDSLTAGVLSDNVAEKITGNIPVMNTEIRIKIIQELKSVDEVILFDSIEEINALSKTQNYVFLYDDIRCSNLIHHPKACSDRNGVCKNNSSDYSSVKPLKGVIGYTTGVFDLFHIGHLNLLKKAKANCDSLIVGVSTNELVQQYKNKLPNIPFLERISIIENLRCVDAVVVQKTMDKFEAWENLKYNILFHGDDWKGSPMYTETEKKLAAVGVKMVYFPYTKGISSTILSKKMSGK